MPDGFTGYVWTETVSAKKKTLRFKKYPDTWVWRHIGDIIDSHISWPWKHFFTSKIVLRVIRLLSIIFVASVPCLRVVVSFARVIRELKKETFSGRRRRDWQSKPRTEVAVASLQNSNIMIAVNSGGRRLGRLPKRKRWLLIKN